MTLAVDFSKKTLVIVTGASQGIGKTIAIEISKCLVANSKIILIARSESGLSTTKELIFNVNKEVIVETITLDLTKPTLEECSNILKGGYDVQQAIIFHNVGQVGKLNKSVTLTDLQLWRDYFDLNVFSVGILNGVLVTGLKGKVEKLYVVNITSLCAKVPFGNMALYGSGKAAREQYFRVFALEEKDIVVLNYSPGPVETQMIDEIIDSSESNELRDEFVTLRESKKILLPNQTVEKLLSILKLGVFKSDYEYKMEDSLMFLIKLAWELKYRIPCLIAVRRIQFQHPLQPVRRRDYSEDLNEDDDSDSWLTTEEDE